MKTNADWIALALVAPVVIAATVAASLWPLALPIVIAAAILVACAARIPNTVAPLIVLIAIPFIRPNILSNNYAPVGTGLCLLAAFVAFAADRGKSKVPRSYLVVSVGVFVLYLWELINASIFGSDTVPVILQGVITTAVTVAAVGLVLADPKRRRVMALGFVWIIFALSVSYVITAAGAIAVGFDRLSIGSFDITRSGWLGSIYLPFTPSTGFQSFSGFKFPRFTGIGREPGWMGMYIGVAFLLWPRVGKVTLFRGGVLLIALIGTFSTAGFGAFSVVVVLAWMARKSKSNDGATIFFGFILKLAALGLAGWVALEAPVVGFLAKGDTNAVSLDDRTNATMAGLSAVIDNPFGGVHTGTSEAINLVAALAPLGIPFSLIVILILLLPRIGHPMKGQTTGPVLMILITLLLSQPALDSTFVFILVGLTYACALPDMAPVAPAEKQPTAVPEKKNGPLSSAYKDLAATKRP